MCASVGAAITESVANSVSARSPVRTAGTALVTTGVAVRAASAATSVRSRLEDTLLDVSKFSHLIKIVLRLMLPVI